MSLDLNAAARQIEALAEALRGRRQEWAASLGVALATLGGADAGALQRKEEESRRTFTFLAARLVDGLAERHDPPSAPREYAALAVDGSHIDVDRHAPPRCFLINTGRVALRYGASPDARLESTPRLYAAPEELVLRDPQGTREVPIEGQLLGMVRTVAELEALAGLCEEAPADAPTLALVDGSLVLWGLSGQAVPDFVRRALLEGAPGAGGGLLPALGRVRRAAQGRRLALAAYVSFPRSTEVTNLLRLARCPYQRANCDHHCGHLATGARPCDGVHGLADRDVLGRWLGEGQRSAVFASGSQVLEHYGEHRVHFFYVNVGPEVARVEVPAWVAEEEALLGLAHALVLDQCRRGQGYPVALMEAHERAVVTGQDRELFRQMVEQALVERGEAPSTSEKARSKRVRWV